MKLVFQPGASSISLPKIGYRPSSDIDYCPLNPYGESKVLGERLVKQQAANAEFIVVRSTSIWGPWLGLPYRDIFERVRRGYYS
jgi:nucleoside-diphosphate-sugar epimerase